MLLMVVRGWAWLLRLNNSLLLQWVSQRCWAFLVVPSLSLFCHRSSIVRSGELPHRFHHVIMNMTLLDKIEVTSGLRFSKLLETSVMLNLVWNLRNICFIVLLIKALAIYYVKRNLVQVTTMKLLTTLILFGTISLSGHHILTNVLPIEAGAS